jgi:TrmH family RNA methyltransferase
MHKISIATENDEYQIIESLKTNRTKRSKAGEAFIEGIEALKQAIAARLELTRIITADYAKLSDWAKGMIAAQPDAKVIELSPALYRKLCDREEPVELVATVRVKTVELADLVLPPKPCVLIFDRPSDFGNFGSILRSADSFGVDAVFVVGHGIDCFDPKVIRSSLGSVFHTKLVAVPSMGELAGWVAEQKRLNGMAVVGTDSTGPVSLPANPLRRPISLVLGNEAKGMSIALKELCDYIVSIPLSGNVNSLNVACAGTVFLWDIYRNGLTQ